MASFVAGFIIVVVASLLGGAGGELLIPTLVLLFGTDVKLAGNRSLSVSLPTILVRSKFRCRQPKQGFPAGNGGGIPRRTFIGGQLLGLVPSGVLLPLLAFILLISAYKIWQHK